MEKWLRMEREEDKMSEEEAELGERVEELLRESSRGGNHSQDKKNGKSGKKTDWSEAEDQIITADKNSFSSFVVILASLGNASNAARTKIINFCHYLDDFS